MLDLALWEPVKFNETIIPKCLSEDVHNRREYEDAKVIGLVHLRKDGQVLVVCV